MPRTKTKSKKPERPAPPVKDPLLSLTDRVGILRAGGLSEEEISTALDIPLTRLRGDFSDALTTARARVRAKIVEVVYASAMRGSPAAQKFFLAETDLIPPPGRSPAPPPPDLDDSEDEVRPRRLGKKEAAQRAALTAEQGTTWAKLVGH